MAEAPALFVACWSRDGKSRFVASDDWLWIRGRYERAAQELSSTVRVEELRRSYGRLMHDGDGIPPWKGMPAGVFRVPAPEQSAGADMFLCARRVARVLPVLGTAMQLEPLVAELRRRGLAIMAFTPETPEESTAVKEPASEARATTEARRLAKALLGRGFVRPAALEALSLGELIWLGEEARATKDASVALEAANLALSRRETPGGFNLRGGALRDLAFYGESMKAYEDSIAVRESAEFNPFAHIGLAATLRRLGRSDEAYDRIKRALHFYPDDRTRAGKYANEVLAAIRRDMRRPLDQDNRAA